ncbi:hypothetical protein [Anaerovorax odorimutans]|uniref:hypothetical protein n=1 Tax=Anaerovorax odorimutans TaxID=109327 RepID=UPI0004004DCA|nr:hypothetical protein [Anaerovorax odorimutans]
MEKKCYKCGSTNVVKVVPAGSACIPGIKEDIKEGRAVVNCCCAGKGSSDIYRCKDCNFEWDYFYELGMKQQEEENDSKDKDKTKDKDTKRKWWKF